MAANANVPPVPVPPVPPPPLTVLNGIVACGFSNVVQVNAGNTSPAQRVASQLYFDNFAMCLTLTDKQIDNAFKAFADLTIADGRIKVMPGLITMLKAFTQHVAHTLRLQLNPEERENAFDRTQMVALTRQRIQQAKFEADNKSEIDGAKPALFSTGPEFGPEQGKVFIVVRALYGLKSAGASFRAFMAKKLDEIVFVSSTADPDVWMRPASKEDGSEYYEYVLMYVDDILAVSMRAIGILKSLEGDTVKYKNGKIEPPTMYLGGKLQQKVLNGKKYWTITSVDYVNAAIQTIKQALKEKRQWKLPGKVTTPMSTNYAPELDDTPELNSDDTQFYQEMMGMLRWATELGRVDILHELSLLAQYQANPRQGHMQEALHIFAYLDKKPKTTLYMNSDDPCIDLEDFRKNNVGEPHDPPILKMAFETTHKCDLPVCPACQLSKQHRRKPGTQRVQRVQGTEMSLRRDNLKPGQKVSCDQYISKTPGRLPHTYGKERPDKQEDEVEDPSGGGDD